MANDLGVFLEQRDFLASHESGAQGAGQKEAKDLKNLAIDKPLSNNTGHISA